MDLNLLQHCELNLLQQIAQICETEHINYWLSGGSLIGAVKYQGMIPWDDDVDVGMLRPDYERFVKAVQTKYDQQDRYALITDLTDADYGVTWSKFIDRQTEIKENFDFSTNTAFIDIMPFDRVADNPLVQTWDKFNFHIVDQLVRERYHLAKHSIFGQLLYLPFRIMCHHLSLQQLKELRLRLMTKRNQSQGHIVMNYASWYDWGHEWVRLSEVHQTTKVPFDKTHLRIPKHHHAILKRMYGDISQTPPKSKQHPDHVKDFRFRTTKHLRHLTEEQTVDAQKQTTVSVRSN